MSNPYPRNVLELPTDIFLMLTQVGTFDLKDIDIKGSQAPVSVQHLTGQAVICLPNGGQLEVSDV